MSGLGQDLKLALRVFWKNPAFAGIVILTLALGSGANTAIFTLLDQVMLRSLPVERPDRLVVLSAPGPFSGWSSSQSDTVMPMSQPMLDGLRDRTPAFRGTSGRSRTPIHFSVKGQTENVNGDMVSGTFFEVLGLRPAHGRLLTREDDRTPSGHPVVVLGHGFFERRFGGDASVVGQTVTVNSHPMTVVGVAPPGWNGVDVGSAVDVYVPLAMQQEVQPTWGKRLRRLARAFRVWPGPAFWTCVYLMLEFGAIWPYLSSNAAVPLAAVILGRLPAQADAGFVRTLGYIVFLSAFVPLIFGGKIYTALERVMVTKLVLILAYLGFVALFFTHASTWWEIGTGFYRFGSLPSGEINWATLAAFSAVAGAGGLTNAAFSNYARDKGWGMGSRVGAIPSAIGGRTIKLSHTGKVFDLTQETLPRWRRWLRVIRRDQFLLWAPGCILGMALPSVISLEFIRGVNNIEGNQAAALTAQAIAARHGVFFWYATLLCGFVIMAPTQVSQIDTIARRWTDILWVGWGRLKNVDEHKVKYVYYAILAVYCVWGLVVLRLTPNPLVLAIASGVMWNFALGFTAIHTLDCGPLASSCTAKAGFARVPGPARMLRFLSGHLRLRTEPAVAGGAGLAWLVNHPSEPNPGQRTKASE